MVLSVNSETTMGGDKPTTEPVTQPPKSNIKTCPGKFRCEFKSQSPRRRMSASRGMSVPTGGRWAPGRGQLAVASGSA
jgi:hypothetical protein